MMLKPIQKALLNARIPAKLYCKGFDSGLKVRCRWRDREAVRALFDEFSFGIKVTVRPTLLPWECRSLLQVVAYVS